MRPKARLLLLVVVIPLIVVGGVFAVARAVLGTEEGPANTVALTGPIPAESATDEPEATPEPTSTKPPKKKSAASPTRTARSGAQQGSSDDSKSGSGGGNGGGTTTSTVSSFATQVIKLTNAERAKVGCKALKSNSLLKSAAQKHSVDMAKKDYFSHTGKDGRSPFQRMTDAGYTFTAAAENIAAGQRTPADVVKGWMNSKGHRENIQNCTYTEIGVGYARGGSYGTYWTQDFGKPA